MTNLTSKESSVLKYITAFFEKHDCIPSYSEITDHFGFKSKNSAAQYVRQLKEKGYMEFRPEALGSDVVRLKIEGRVAAGLLTEAIEDIEYLDYPKSNLKTGESYFALRVFGDSMIDDHIMNGDIVILRQTNTIRDGMIGVVKVDGEATLKRIYKKKNSVELVPSNRDFKPITIKDSSRWNLVGELFSVFRQY